MDDNTDNTDHDHKRGKIVDNKLAAIVTSDLYRTRVVENKKRYKRKPKHKNSEEK